MTDWDKIFKLYITKKKKGYYPLFKECPQINEENINHS